MVSVEGVDVKLHAYQRWVQRIGSKNSDYLGYGVPKIFDESVPVGLKDAHGKVRFHPPTDSLFIYKTENGTHIVKTAYPKGSMEVKDDHLKVCDGCEMRYNPETDDECPWCDGG